MAASTICRVAGYGDNAAHVESDRGQDPIDADSVDKPLMARDVLRNFARPDDIAYPA